MTTELTNPRLNEASSGLSSLASDFYEVSFRREGEGMEERNNRALTYFGSLSLEEQEYLESLPELKSTLRCLRGEGFN